LTSEQKEQQTGEKLRQPGQTQVKRAARDLVNLPADGYGLHLKGRHGEESGSLKESKIRVLECSAC
jgi:hypothetical protein